MNIRKFGLAVTHSRRTLSLDRHASPEKDSVNACRTRFAARIATAGAAAPMYELEYHGNRAQ